MLYKVAELFCSDAVPQIQQAILLKADQGRIFSCCLALGISKPAIALRFEVLAFVFRFSPPVPIFWYFRQYDSLDHPSRLSIGRMRKPYRVPSLCFWQASRRNGPWCF